VYRYLSALEIAFSRDRIVSPERKRDAFVLTFDTDLCSCVGCNVRVLGGLL